MAINTWSTLRPRDDHLKFNGLKEISLFFVGGVFKERLYVRAHSGDCDLAHDGDSLPEELRVLLVRICAVPSEVVKKRRHPIVGFKVARSVASR